MKIFNIVKDYLKSLLRSISEDDEETDFVRNYSKYSKLYNRYNI